MKKLILVSVMLVVMSISARAYGFVAVYNAFGILQAIDTATDSRDLKIVNGFIVLDINEAEGTAVESSVVLFGREGWQSRIFTVSPDAADLATFGNFVTLTIDTGTGNTIILTGRTVSRNVGLSARVLAAVYLDGGIMLEDGQLFNPDETLVGAGAMEAILNNSLTRNANRTALTVAEVVDAIIAKLEARGFVQLAGEVSPPD